MQGRRALILPVSGKSVDCCASDLSRVVQCWREKFPTFAFSEFVIYSRPFRSEEGAYASSRTWSGMWWTQGAD
jgi:hypothetical protein